MSNRVQKTITGRELRRSTPEEKLAPGESILVRKQGGKVFELKRIESGEKSILQHLDELIEEIPNPGQRVCTNLARIIVEDRE